jgi:hypothetical protein
MLEKPADTRSPWYEAFTPPAPPAVPALLWVMADAALPAQAASDDVSDEAWATEALFDYYND